MKYLSLFSGIGGFELGIHNAFKTSKQKAVCIGYSEIDRHAITVYEKKFPSHKNLGDVRTINTDEIKHFDLLVGGFPCQAFSIAGKRLGFADPEKGTQFFEIARILRDKRPRYFLLENVKGILSHDNNITFKIIIATLDELGYDVEWQVLNSKDFGVPQNRERVFIVGHLRGTSRPKIFSFGRQTNPHNTKSQSAETAVARTLTAGANHSGMTIIQLNDTRYSEKRIYSDQGIAPTLTTLADKQPKIARTIRTGGRSSPHGSKQNWDSYAIKGKIRRLTPIECERLQGFPDNYTKGISTTQRYKTLGNAVTVNVIEELIKAMFRK